MANKKKPKWIRNAQHLFKKAKIIKYSVIDQDKNTYKEYEVDQYGKRKES